MPLTMAPAGRELKIVKVLAEESVKHHLENLGILAGEIFPCCPQAAET